MLCPAWNTSMKLNGPLIPGHTVREAALAYRIDDKNSRSCGNRSRVCYNNPRGVDSLKLSSYSRPAQEETPQHKVKNYKLVWASVIQPLVIGW